MSKKRKKRINQVKIKFNNDPEHIRKLCDMDDGSCISVGGLAHQMGMLKTEPLDMETLRRTLARNIIFLAIREKQFNYVGLWAKVGYNVEDCLNGEPTWDQLDQIAQAVGCGDRIAEIKVEGKE